MHTSLASTWNPASASSRYPMSAGQEVPTADGTDNKWHEVCPTAYPDSQITETRPAQEVSPQAFAALGQCSIDTTPSNGYPSSRQPVAWSHRQPACIDTSHNRPRLESP